MGFKRSECVELLIWLPPCWAEEVLTLKRHVCRFVERCGSSQNRTEGSEKQRETEKWENLYVSVNERGNMGHGSSLSFLSERQQEKEKNGASASTGICKGDERGHQSTAQLVTITAVKGCAHTQKSGSLQAKFPVQLCNANAKAKKLECGLTTSPENSWETSQTKHFRTRAVKLRSWSPKMIRRKLLKEKLNTNKRTERLGRWGRI